MKIRLTYRIGRAFRQMAYGLCLGFALLQMATECHGQDPVLSQLPLQPLLANPANAGSDATMRATLGHRSQWKSVGVPFVSNAMAFDMRVARRGGKDDTGGLGVGVMFFNDRAGDPEFACNQLNLAVAYTLNLSREASLSTGLTLAWDQRSVDIASGQWGSQYNGVQFDPGRSSGEAFANDRLSAVHAGGGLVYSYDRSRGDKRGTREVRYKLGVSASQIGRLDISESATLRHEFAERYLLFAESAFDLGKGGFGLEPSAWYMSQAGYDLLMVGSYVRYALIEGSTFAHKSKPLYAALGSFWRMGDAVVATARIDWGDYTFGMSYDFSVSKITERLPHTGAWELAVAWRMQ